MSQPGGGEPLPNPLAVFIVSPMKRRALLTVLAGLLLFETGALIASAAPTGAWWIVFLVLTPACLGTLVWWGFRWAAMACVMYGTVGLALDLSTMVHVLTKDAGGLWSLSTNLVSGGLNFLLILLGGRSFLGWVAAQPPPGSRPPNPPALSSSEEP